MSDVVIVGAGAAGLATAIFAARARPGLDVLVLDGARTIGAKILVSGGSRCNVTNRVVTERDFWGGSPRLVTRVLRAFPADRAARFFEELGVALHEEEDGKLFPDSNSSRTVLDALLAEAARRGVTIESGARVVAVRDDAGGFTVERAGGASVHARTIVLATGGRSLPKSGSDGFGYQLAAAFGHGCVATTPALAPLVLRGSVHAELAGVSHPAALSLRAAGTPLVRLEGSLLWTHFGASGPVVLNLSRHWHRAALEAGPSDQAAAIDVHVSLLPGETFESAERWLLDEAAARPRAQVATVLGQRLPQSVAGAWVALAGLARDATMAHLTREDRRRLAHALLATRLDVEDSRGYKYAEVTAGGVPLDEIDTATMESRRQPGLYLVGEILDVDGRLGGFNFQWAWSSGWVAGHALARGLSAGR
ncbi:MAG TPA: aminoacetone oxidase family FAD-binding enzyme [Vicinamibacterales bacterium]|nr:aminoacetone oxidase family FAD-binding enzyme [Vicinamibacterales bacterium]